MEGKFTEFSEFNESTISLKHEFGINLKILSVYLCLAGTGHLGLLHKKCQVRINIFYKKIITQFS